MEKYTNDDYKNIAELVVMIANFYNDCASNIDEEERIFDNLSFVQSRLKLMDKIAILYNRIIDIMNEELKVKLPNNNPYPRLKVIDNELANYDEINSYDDLLDCFNGLVEEAHNILSERIDYQTKRKGEAVLKIEEVKTSVINKTACLLLAFDSVVLSAGLGARTDNSLCYLISGLSGGIVFTLFRSIANDIKLGYKEYKISKGR